MIKISVNPTALDANPTALKKTRAGSNGSERYENTDNIYCLSRPFMCDKTPCGYIYKIE